MHRATFYLFALLLGCVTSGVLAQSPTSRPASPDEQVVGQLLGPRYRAVHTAYFTLYTGQANWPPDFVARLDKFCDDFFERMDEAGFEVHRPATRLLWIGFDDRDAFDDYTEAVERVRLPWLCAFYSTRSNRVAVITPLLRQQCAGDGSPKTCSALSACGVELLHEAAHQLSFNCGLFKRGVMYPLWVTEGLATNFEMGARQGVDNPQRHDQLVDTRQASRMQPLFELVSATSVPADAEQARQFYAQSWGLFRFLLESRPEQMKQYMSKMSALPMGRRSPQELREEFEAAFGDIASLQQGWDGYVASLDRRRRVAVVEAPVVRE